MCELKQKLDEWTDWLAGDDVHSVRKQINSLIWDTAFFRCINEARNHSPTDDKGEPLLNGEVHRLINCGFWVIQSINIRKLIDRSNDVISLWRLIDDIEKNHKIVTRGNLLEAHGYPYDYEREKHNILQKVIASQQNGVRSYNDEMSVGIDSMLIHESMDELAGVEKANRQASDTIEFELFGFLKARLDQCDEVRTYVNKFVAHSASPKSRQEVNADGLEITLGKIYDAQQILCETAGFIGQEILYHSLGGFLPVPQFNQFKHFEKPWIDKDSINKLYDEWSAFDKETRGWTQWDWKAEYERR